MEYAATAIGLELFRAERHNRIDARGATRRAGTKHEAAATAVSSAATVV